MLNRSQVSRNPFLVTWTQAVMARLLLGRSRRLQRQRTQQRQHESFELLEIRTLLSASPVLTGIDSADHHDDEVHSHPVFAPGTSQAYVDSFNDNIGAAGGTGVGGFNSSRWTTTATNGSGLTQGTPTTLTWSIVSDGTAIPALGGINTESSAGSNLVAYLGGIYGVSTNDLNYTDEPWFAHFQSVFSRWSQLTGINYVYSAADDGAAFTNTTANPGVLGVRGDVRIGGHYIDGNSNVLAYNFFPNHGDMVIDTGDNFFSDPIVNNANNSRRLRNTLAHEAGHGIGLNHVDSDNAAFLMEPFIDTRFDGPQLDDILAAQRMYGDDFEPNDTAATARTLGSLPTGQSFTVGPNGNTTFVGANDVQFISIDGASDTDFYSFTATTSGSVSVTLTPQGTTYNQGPQGGTQTSLNTSTLNVLDVQLIGTNGSTVLANGATSPAGPFKTLSFLVPSAGTYYVKVTGTVDNVQMYRLNFGLTSVTPAGVSIVQSGGTTEVAEGGATDSYAVALSSQPSSNVTITIGGSSQVTTSTTSLIFTPTNWNVAQTVTVTAVNDLLYEGFHVAKLSHSVTSTDLAYNSLNPSNVRVVITDDDTAALSVSISPNSISENGGSALGTVTRNTADVSQALDVTLISSDTSELTVPTFVTIPAGASSAAFTVTAVDDTLLDGTQTATIAAFSNTTGGSLDASFGTGGLAAIPDYQQNLQPSFPEIVEQPDGKYIVAGRHLTLTNAWNVIRLNRDGSLDTTFGVGGVVTTTFPSDIQPQGIALYPDGQILVLGRSLAGSNHGVARYTSSGVLNLQINPTTTNIFGHDVVVDNIGDGGFLVGGSNTLGTDFAVTRYRNNGTVDTTYGTAGTATLVRSTTSEAGWAMAQQVDGKVVVVGTTDGNFGATRFNRNGTTDTGFNFTGLSAVNFGSFDSAQAVAIAPDGKIVLAGITNGNWAITRLAANGALDTSFGTFGIVNQDFFGLSDDARTVGVQADGRIVVGGGAFISGQGTNLALARYNVNGTLDTTFDFDGKLVLAAQPSVFEETRALAIQADGNIIALGGYQSSFFAFRVLAGQPSLQFGSTTVQVTDYETLSLNISPSTISENGGVATGTIVRSNTDLSSPLTVTLANGDSSEISIPATVTIPAGQSSVTFSINGVDESLIDGTQVVSIDATASGYVGATSSINVTDDETTRLVATVNPGQISEAAGTAAATLTITRNSSTASALTIALSSSDGTEAVVQSTVVIPAGQNLVTVPVDSVDDFIVDGSVTVTVSGSAGGHDTGTSGLVVTDNDSAGVTVNPVVGLETTEAGGTASLSVVLTSQPTANVTIPVASSDSSEGIVSVSSLTFTPANWNIAQVVTITGVDDLQDDGDVLFSVLTATVISSDPNYSGLNPSDVTATNLDDDLAQLSLTVSSASISEGAGGNAATATVSRNSDDSQPLTVTLLVNDGSEASVPVSVVIPAGASSVSFDISAIDDLIVDGTQAVTISAAAAGHIGTSVALNVTDDDVAGFSIIGGGVLTVDESGSTQTFGVVLNAAPLTNVVITITSGDLTEATVAPAMLTFTPANWNLTQLVTLTGVDDVVDDDAQLSTITVSVSSSLSDEAFDAIASSTVTALTLDNDTAGITFTPNTGLLIVEGSVSDSVAITLKTQPTANVTFALNNATPDQVTFSTSSLTFTPSNWNVPQVVVITGIDNQIAEDGFGVGITPEPAVSADPKYSGLQAGGANGSIIDDDLRGVIVGAVLGSISEHGTSTTFSIVLNSEPTGNVSVPISSGDLTEGSVSVSVLNFTPLNWNVPQFVSVTGVNDSIVDGDIRFDVVTGAISGTSDYAGIDPEDVSVLNLDNDVLTLLLTITPTSISENGGTATGTVSRNDGNLSLPLTVSLFSSDTSEASVPTTVTIPAGQTSVIFTVSGVDDTLNDGAQPVMISSTAGGYIGANDALSVTDNDGPVISVNTLTISEGGSVVLTSAQISTSDPEFGPTQLVYSASGISGGRFELTTAPGVAITSFSQAQINAGVIRFVHNGGEAAPTYVLTVAAGTQNSPALSAVINFTNVNDAPIVSGALNNISVLQGAANQTISLLNVFSDVDNVTLTYSAVSSNGALVGTSVSGSNLTVSFSATLTGVTTVTVTATNGT